MVLKPIINSLLDTDFYKFTMGQVILHQYPSYQVTWSFNCRNKDVIFSDEMVKEISEQIDHYCKLSFKKDELDYLRKFDFLKGNYIDFLSVYHPLREHIEIKNEGKLLIEAKGPWFLTTYYETPILAIVNEVYFRFKYKDNYQELAENQMLIFNQKLEDIRSGKYHLSTFSEFGTRRRFSYESHNTIVEKLAEAMRSSRLGDSVFVGTSNVLMAYKHNVLPVGTMAHEIIMAIGQGNHELNPAYSNKFALKSWVDEYGTKNGIYLTDTIGTDNCLLDFNDYYSTIFSGVRHDSGDPFLWGNKILKHYRDLGINPKEKTLLFSDGLTFAKATEINEYFKDLAHVAFGIGTHITNDTGVEALNIVMKLTLVNGQAVAKCSDELGKTMCFDEEYVEYLYRSIKWRETHDKNSNKFESD